MEPARRRAIPIQFKMMLGSRPQSEDVKVAKHVSQSALGGVRIFNADEHVIDGQRHCTSLSGLASEIRGRRLRRRQEINVRALYQLSRLHAESLHQNVGLSNAALGSFAIFKYHLQLEKAAQSLDLVQMDPRSSNEKECSMLSYSARLAVRQ
jgi:hypothetical protein